MADDSYSFVAMLDADIDRVSLIGPVVGTHSGPGVLRVVYRRA